VSGVSLCPLPAYVGAAWHLHLCGDLTRLAILDLQLLLVRSVGKSHLLQLKGKKWGTEISFPSQALSQKLDAF